MVIWDTCNRLTKQDVFLRPTFAKQQLQLVSFKRCTGQATTDVR